MDKETDGGAVGEKQYVVFAEPTVMADGVCSGKQIHAFRLLHPLNQKHQQATRQLNMLPTPPQPTLRRSSSTSFFIVAFSCSTRAAVRSWKRCSFWLPASSASRARASRAAAFSAAAVMAACSSC
jgi:hypothetical protein